MHGMSGLASAGRNLLSIVFIAAVPLSAGAQTVPDMSYVHCPGVERDLRISELTHTVSQFSNRFQQYRPVCRECTVTEWGNRITLRGGDGNFIQINRVTGYVIVERSSAQGDGSPFAVRSFRATCARGTMVVPNVALANPSRIF